MSAAIDEAEGPEENGEYDAEQTQDDQMQHVQDILRENRPQTQRTEKVNGLKSQDHGALRHEGSEDSGGEILAVDSEDLNVGAPFRPGPERPSSADGSLSIPDDTPSLQVGVDLYMSSGRNLIMSGLYHIILSW